MCGIAGFVGYGGLPANEVAAIATRMGSAMRHRGPDDAGIWCDEAVPVALAHRRLSILDLSPAGHQPMVSVSGRFVVVFNGELYNHLELRAMLDQDPAGGSAGLAWRGHADTETLLAGIEAWGLEETLRRSTGMFAIGLWDRRERALALARDRMGEKPLYYGWQRGVFLFGSELKALKVHPAFVGEIDRNSIALQLRHSYIPAPYSIYKGIYKLPPASILRLDSTTLSGAAVDTPIALKPYWSLAEAVERGRAAPFAGTDTEAVAVLEDLLRNAVGRQMVADVPLGAFLSGGVDSSTIVALMQSQSARPVKTFTIGFNEADYDEAKQAKAVARYLGTEHTELYVTSGQALDVIPRLPTLYDEPFSDSSQLPTFLVAEMTRQHVTVSLSGDAGDELFGGYNRYFWAARYWGLLSLLPIGLRQKLAALLVTLSPRKWNDFLRFLPRLTPADWRQVNLGDKVHKGARLLARNNLVEFYLGCVSHWEDPEILMTGTVKPVAFLRDNRYSVSNLNDIEFMMLEDMLTYLPDDILCKVDRAAMGVSLETRVPMLDHRLVEFAWRLPMHYKIRKRQSKWILRQVLYKYVPKELIERPKMGFAIPIDSWLRGPLREWAEDLLGESRLCREGYFNPVPIRQKWREHLSGARNWQYHLWDVLMFQAWLNSK